MSTGNQGYLTDAVSVSRDPLVVRYTDFDPSKMYLEPPKDGVSKKDKNVTFCSCAIRYIYTKRDGSTAIGMLQLEGPRGWAREGVKPNTDKDTKLRTGTYSYGHEVSGSTPEGKKFIQVLDQIYKRLCEWFLANKIIFPRAGDTDHVASKANSLRLEDNHAVFPWDGCKYLYKPIMVPGKDEVAPDSSAKIWCTVNIDGPWAPKFYNIESILDEQGNIKKDPETGAPLTKKFLLGPDVYMESAIEGYPVWIFNDWYISSGHRKIRFGLKSVLVSDLDIKGVTFDQDQAAGEEALRRHALEADPIKAAIATIMSSRKQNNPNPIEGSVQGFFGAGNSSVPDHTKNEMADPFGSLGGNSSSHAMMQTPVQQQQPLQTPVQQQQPLQTPVQQPVQQQPLQTPVQQQFQQQPLQTPVQQTHGFAVTNVSGAGDTGYQAPPPQQQTHGLAPTPNSGDASYQQQQFQQTHGFAVTNVSNVGDVGYQQPPPQQFQQQQFQQQQFQAPQQQFHGFAPTNVGQTSVPWNQPSMTDVSNVSLEQILSSNAPMTTGGIQF